MFFACKSRAMFFSSRYLLASTSMVCEVWCMCTTMIVMVHAHTAYDWRNMEILEFVNFGEVWIHGCWLFLWSWCMLFLTGMTTFRNKSALSHDLPSFHCGSHGLMTAQIAMIWVWQIKIHRKPVPKWNNPGGLIFTGCWFFRPSAMIRRWFWN